MKPGTIVECIDDTKTPCLQTVVFPERKKLYTVRKTLDGSLTCNGQLGIYLEEIHNDEVLCELKTGTFIMEPSFRESRFKEIKMNFDELFGILGQTNMSSNKNSHLQL